MEFSVVERLTLIVLLVATLAIFARELRRQILRVVAGQPDRPRTDHLGTRLLRVGREVLLQSRVIGGRPIVGSLHAVVFAGFIFFGVATIDHFLRPFGLHFIDRLPAAIETFFTVFLSITAVAVSVAIVGLAFRRFVMVNSSPDPKAYSSGFVALLILLLMLTYLYGLEATGTAGKANWWLHALIIIVFPHLILSSKHFHILLAPINIFFRTENLGDYLPLDLDMEALAESDEEISLGLETMADAPWKMRLDFLACVECKRCTEQCPAWNSGQALNPRQFILDGRAALDQDGPVIGSVISEEALGQCTSCGACEAICPVGIEHLQVLLGAKRAQALATGTGMVAADFLQKVETYGNPFSEPTSTRTKLIEELEIPYFKPGVSEVLLWMGCVWSYNKDARSSLEGMVKILDKAGVRYGVLEKESCSGHHSRRQGEELQFQTLALDNVENLKAAGVQKVVAPCPHCLHTLRREYPTVDDEFSVDVVHHSELVVDLVQQGALTIHDRSREGSSQADPSTPAKLTTYHDPCYLGRYEDVFEAPREIIKMAGHKMIELPRHGRRSFCCGGGSAGFRSERELKRRVDQERSDEIVASGADILITSCPECKMMLDTAVGETKDLAELVAESI